MGRASGVAFARRHAVAVLAALGLGLMGVWMNLVGYSTAFAPEAVTSEVQLVVDFSRYAFYIGVVACGAMYLVFGDRLDARRQLLDAVVCFLMCFGTFAFGIAYQQTLFPPHVLAACGCLFSGFGYSWIVVSFYLMLAERTTVRVAVLAIGASLVFETVCALFLNISLPDLAQIVIGILMPVAATGIVYAVRRRRIGAEGGFGRLRKLAGKEEGFQVLILVLASFGLLVIRGITTVGLWGGVRSDYSVDPVPYIVETLGACALLLLLGYATLARSSDKPLYARYQTAILVLVVGFVAFLVSNFWFSAAGQMSIGSMLVQSIELFGHLLYWTVSVAGVQLLRFSKYRVMAFGLLLYNGLAMVWMAFLEDLPDLVTTCVLMAIFAIIFCIAIIPANIGRDKSGSLEYCCERLAQEKGLTAREQEVLVLLALGRSRPYIQKKLVLAEGTVKTHSSNIYRKIGVHSRQELLDLMEKMG